MRYENFKPNAYYHVSGSGAGDSKIFIDDKDRVRFIFLMTHFQSPIQIYNVSWYTESFLRKGRFSMGEGRVHHILKERNVELLAFAITPTSFSILLRNIEDSVLSVYMHRILTAYGRYFNRKYNKKGHVFRGPFTATLAKNNSELARLSAVMHASPKEIKEWQNSYDKYPWSSYQDYIGLNRWGNLISTEVILRQFKDQAKYKDFVSTI